MDIRQIQADLLSGATALGLEFGSTNIKAHLIDSRCRIVASGSYSWESHLENGLWTYGLEEAVAGMQACYRMLAEEVLARYGTPLTTIGAVGISGMMHGYLALDREDVQIAPFITWRNTNTAEASRRLSALFETHIPLRWSIAQLYHAVLQRQAHAGQVDKLFTLAGYIHWRLTGRHVAGLGEASGMFPVDSDTGDYRAELLAQFDDAVAAYQLPWHVKQLLPQVLPAGGEAGCLTPAGARLLDPSGLLQAGIPFAPPEGDAATGMVATNTVEVGAGNVSAGTSLFLTMVLDKRLAGMHPDIDQLTSPTGQPAAMVHCINGTAEIDQWMHLFSQLAGLLGVPEEKSTLYDRLFRLSLAGEPEAGQTVAYHFLAGEHVLDMEKGCPMVLRTPASRLDLANFMRAQLYAPFAPLALGVVKLRELGVQISRLTGHGGLFKTPEVAQRYLAAAINVPVTVMETAATGGAYGMALLASYRLQRDDGETLEDYLRHHVFSKEEYPVFLPDPADVRGFDLYLSRFKKGLSAERAALRDFLA